MPRVVLQDGSGREVVCSFDERNTLVGGRETDADIVVADDLASRRHFAIEKREDGFFLKDLGSTNGTLVNEIPVAERRLESGDRIRVGNSVFALRIEEEPDEAVVFHLPSAPRIHERSEAGDRQSARADRQTQTRQRTKDRALPLIAAVAGIAIVVATAFLFARRPSPPKHDVAVESGQSSRVSTPADMPQTVAKASATLDEAKEYQRPAMVERHPDTDSARKAQIQAEQIAVAGQKRRIKTLWAQIDDCLAGKQYETALAELRRAAHEPDFKWFEADLAVGIEKIEALLAFRERMANAGLKLRGQRLAGLPGQVKEVTGTSLELVSGGKTASVDLKFCKPETLNDIARKVSPDSPEKFLLGLNLFRDGQEKLALKPSCMAMANYLVEIEKTEALLAFREWMANAGAQLQGQRLAGLPDQVRDVTVTSLEPVSGGKTASLDLKSCRPETLNDIARKVSPDSPEKFLLGIGLYLFQYGQEDLALKPLCMAMAKYLAEAQPTPHSLLWDIEEYYGIISSLRQAEAEPGGKKRGVRYVGSDWQTRGDWIGRYGRSAWVLCAALPPFDWSGGPLLGRFAYRCYIGENCKAGDVVRYWCWRPDDPNGRRVLRNPLDGGRRPACWDDHGEVYPFLHDGPHLYSDLDIPPGNHVLSFYFVNYDGHAQTAALRDYTLLVKGRAESSRRFDAAPVLAVARVTRFYGGVYHRFAVAGPVRLTVKVRKDLGFNEMVSGVFLDPIDAPFLEDERERTTALSATNEQALEAPLIDTWLRESMLTGKERGQSEASSALCELYVQRCCSLIQLLRDYYDRDPLGYAAFARPAALYLVRKLDAIAKTSPILEPTLKAQRLLAEGYHATCFYDDRDQAWGRYVAMFEKAMTDAKTVGQWQNFKRSSWCSPEQEGQLARVIFSNRAKTSGLERERVLSEATELVYSSPHIAQTAFEAACEGGNLAMKTLSGEQLFAYAQSLRAQDKHRETYAVFDAFQQRFPRHPLLQNVKGKLLYTAYKAGLSPLPEDYAVGLQTWPGTTADLASESRPE